MERGSPMQQFVQWGRIVFGENTNEVRPEIDFQFPARLPIKHMNVFQKLKWPNQMVTHIGFIQP